MKLRLKAALTLSLLSLMYQPVITTNTQFVMAEAVETTIESDAVIANVSQPFHYNQHALLELDVEEGVQIEQIVADVSQLGGSSQLTISPELLKVTLSVTHDVEPGDYTIPITWWDSDEQEYQTETTVTILPREKEEGELDWDEEIIYFMLTDRFKDGDESNNNPWDLAYEEADNQRGVYQGGDFKGITEQIDYLDELGITTIWISPIVSNIAYDVSAGTNDGAFYGYHGYWAQNFEELNPHFGTLEEFHELIDTAAEKDIKIMVDVVLNHAGYGMHSKDSEVDNAPEGYPTDGEREVFEGMLRDSPGMDSLTQELSGLPDFTTEKQDVYEQLVDWQTAWLDLSTTPTGNSISSFRVDTVIHVDNTAWQHFRNELTEIDPDFQLIGEVWGASATSPKGYLNSGMMDSVLDFEFKNYARNFINGDFRGVNSRLERRNGAMTSASPTGQFLSSHDETGFLYMLNGNEDKYKVAVTLQMTAKGQPVIYYGEELGQTGANNWPVYDNRYDLAWDQTEDNDILTHYKKLLQFRRANSEVLARGTREVYGQSLEDQWTIVTREHEGEQVYIVFNLSEDSHAIHLPVSSENAAVTDAYSDNTYNAETTESGEVTVELTIPPITEGGTMLLVVEEGEMTPMTEE